MEDMLIIGGGFAGLTAAVALSKAGRTVRLLEQRPRLGGRAYSFRDSHTGAIVDNGQHILMGCYHATHKFLKEIGTVDRIVFQPELRVQFLDASGRLTALRCPSLPAPWHLLAGILLSSAFDLRQKLEVLRLGFTLDSGQLTANNSERQTVDEWLRSLGQSETLRRNFWDLLCIAALNEDPRIASAVLFERVLRLSLFASPCDSRIGLARCGLSDCYTQAAAAYIAARGGRVETGRSVSEFLISRRGTCDEPGTRDPEPRVPARHGQDSHATFVCDGVRLADGEVVQAPVVLSAVPCFQLRRLLPSDLLRSEPFFRAVVVLRPAPIISINLWFDRPVTDLDFVALRGTTVQWLFNKGKILGSDEGYVSLVLSGAHQHVDRSREELVAIALRELKDLLPASRQARLAHSLIIKERFATFSPSIDAEAVRPPSLTPVQGLYLAGDWTATGLPATIEGAVKSGYTAAEAILNDFGV
jgi:squalene-associated FAD-dependent desaturase